jgi:hypothetical protein
LSAYLIPAIAVLLALGLVLFIVDRRKPSIFRLKASITKWISFDLEMHGPEGKSGLEDPPARP